ncbi:MAG TPA: hypothetical protein VN764_12350, partial [Polyangiaceae bacterium]|nr:hypothetical protein [Polyangiaceae bacterium]
VRFNASIDAENQADRQLIWALVQVGHVGLREQLSLAVARILVPCRVTTHVGLPAMRPLIPPSKSQAPPPSSPASGLRPPAKCVPSERRPSISKTPTSPETPTSLSQRLARHPIKSVG